MAERTIGEGLCCVLSRDGKIAETGHPCYHGDPIYYQITNLNAETGSLLYKARNGNYRRIELWRNEVLEIQVRKKKRERREGDEKRETE